jgi:Tfp pilus assembly protein PilN
MAFWNRKRDDKQHEAVKRLTQVIENLRREVNQMRARVEGLQHDVETLHARVNGQPVPTNGQSRDGSAVQDWLPVIDRMQELLLVQMGNADLAQAFGTYARQRELRASEEQPDTTWTEPNGSTYENL